MKTLSQIAQLPRLESPLRRTMHTANNKKWYIRNKRLLAEYEYYHHAVPQKLWLQHQLSRGKPKFPYISGQPNEYFTPTPTILNPLTSPIFRDISYLHVIGPREQTSTKVIKKGFRTSNEDIEEYRAQDEIQPTNDSVVEDMNSLREHERLMELDLSTSAIRNATQQTVDSHQHLLYSDPLPSMSIPARSFLSVQNSKNQGKINSPLSRSFFTSFISKISTPASSNSNSSDEQNAKTNRIEKASQKLEGISKESDVARNHLREKSFESDEASLVEDEQRLHDLDLSATAVRDELKEDGAIRPEEFVPGKDESERSLKFQARAYEDLEDSSGQPIYDEESETNSSHKV